MAGHSKWNNIKQRKGAQDAKRGKIFQKLSKEIYKAAKDGGADPEMNASLRLAVDKAKSNNMPNDNIDRAIKRATDAGQGDNYDEAIYEGYGPNGIAVLVHALTDNLNRSSTNIRVAFDRNGGSLGEKGSVSYMFDRKGYIAIDREKLDVDEDTMLMEVLEAGGEELETSDEAFEIYTEATDFTVVRDALKEAGYTLAQAELTMLPQTTLPVPEDKEEIFEQMIDALEDDDDVSEVYHNAEI
ncbi:MAG: YebC/PmpR family DNA-binding transcriptional regulator [Alkalibacterium sp.]|uniref:Probable transcriptional regulatory protein SAMN04488113_10260 n=1 Tax=Alkalibacterium gilvum TaxID=1130080 RepID=A0A1H6RMW9_9LACT|nr:MULTISPECIES: YebC/PmpR family DNA-binding transcriptional regulator [Alkalibacterium]MDN6294203.1 YebC/PmpR family DNA-binding transcriptional regulator [Alkalibacterium sp.]MDN6295496.1 YebC/PmpR family DNA-binding transcriptional regulator [Alkalibacterium sp.]MDN6327018.1 YebC/PmpR family DNA-binding transcriptional regulator [Alkalibacterium sp.]MDN6397999.1 YebC/PmpR family DNA-binding transcriptional regulator [Alkalibacterium sp.]SEI52552.1 DNA-binding regulatory protein, YebC/PmpR 